MLNACTTNIRHFFEPKRQIDFDHLLGEYKESKPYRAYKMYGDSKMALLMLTFKLADQFMPLGIKVNADQIPAIKISKETMKQMKSLWKVAARIQNLFNNTQESMADTYFTLCTSNDFKDVTGQLINADLKIVKSSHYKENFKESLKQFFDQGVYPKYADHVENIEQAWDFCFKLTQEYLKL